MIQRIQSVYLVVAALLCIACLCLPIGQFTDASGDTISTLYNLWVHIPYAGPVGSTITTAPVDGEPVLAEVAAGQHLFTPWALFALLVIIATGLLFSIFLYRTRLVQSRLAMLCCILLIGWYAAYVAFSFMLEARFNADFSPTPWAAFPAIACIFSYLAFRAIVKDEALVRSLDRLR
ncbi:MAG: DUF4293 domain-containing protein [Bacteroidaceae bacterium]|nr:DUF4293 domain-containing protein [Bacteroidaceae bacterium]